ncbi:hypothetical protein BA190_09520 [Labrys sp. WJW]|uniref:hypothetical protein n=1 Tax=Labrys sp. WJW TaxID=1737983 RepID=UPI00082A2407|nr:hypothetical protein [Labrys sp. WJW]OCC05145.1 hypothetical protein BA190_09520 [Labrys sp. WJW]
MTPLDVVREAAATYKVPAHQLMGGRYQGRYSTARLYAVRQLRKAFPRLKHAEVAELVGVGARRISAMANSKRIIIPPNNVDPMEVIKQVAAEHGIAPADILKPGRFKHLVAARYDAIRLVHAMRPDLPYLELARIFKRDGSTIRYALSRPAADTGAPN